MAPHDPFISIRAGYALQDLARRKGLKTGKVAKMTSLAHNTVLRAFDGTPTIHLKSILRVAEALGASLSFRLIREGQTRRVNLPCAPQELQDLFLENSATVPRVAQAMESTNVTIYKALKRPEDVTVETLYRIFMTLGYWPYLEVQENL